MSDNPTETGGSPWLYFLTGLTAGLFVGLVAGLALSAQSQRLGWEGPFGLSPWAPRRSQAQAALESLRRYG